MNPEGAQPYATISMYDDLVQSKDLGLVRADITPNLSKKVRDTCSRDVVIALLAYGPMWLLRSFVHGFRLYNIVIVN